MGPIFLNPSDSRISRGTVLHAIWRILERRPIKKFFVKGVLLIEHQESDNTPVLMDSWKQTGESDRKLASTTVEWGTWLTVRTRGRHWFGSNNLAMVRELGRQTSSVVSFWPVLHRKWFRWDSIFCREMYIISRGQQVSKQNLLYFWTETFLKILEIYG